MDVVVYAPASIGNVSVGFDVLGAAVSPVDGTLLGDRVQVKAGTEPFSLKTAGNFVSKLPTEPKENIVYDCWLVFSRELDKKGVELKPLEMTLEKNMPIGSGLGSSACSIVAALDALNRFHGQPLNETELLALMGEMEGKISGGIHYDNVAPCYLGGVQLMLEELGIISQEVPCFDDWYWVMAYPGIKVSTAEAREILPSQYRRQDIIAHGRHLAGFIHACHSGQPDTERVFENGALNTAIPRSRAAFKSTWFVPSDNPSAWPDPACGRQNSGTDRLRFRAGREVSPAAGRPGTSRGRTGVFSGGPGHRSRR